VFTGLIDDVGRIEAVSRTAAGLELRISCRYDDLVEGESIAVNGACLTVLAHGNGWFTVGAITTTLGLGSGVWVPGFGVHLNSMLGEGELIRGELVPGQRMGSMMSPLLAFADGGPVAVAGAAGGSRIRPALIQCLLGMIGGLPPQEAIDAPRLNAVPGLVRLEPGFSEAVIRALQQTGDRVAVAEMRAPYFGGVSALSTLGGGADVRRGGTVILL